jgi:hypothetical protein
MSLNIPAANAIRRTATEQISVARERASRWRRGLAFFFGFGIQFNILVGGGTEGASATGGYGYRLFDFVCLGAVGLLGLHSLTPRRILPLALYGLIVGILFVAPALSSDPRTAILTYHYMLYSLAALYVVIVLEDVVALERFCWGLILGLLATVPIFVLQDSVFSSKLVEWGLTPGYSQVAWTDGSGYTRYAGLWSHPNEAGHIAALSAAAGAYFAFVRRRFLPLALVFVGLISVFYYARSRGGFIAGGAIIAIPFLVARGRTSIFRLIVMSAGLLLSIILVSQIEFIGARFGNDANEINNIAQRLESIESGLNVILTSPFGMPIDEFLAYVSAGSGGTTSPHNGFIFFGGVFGLLPLLAFLMACATSVRVRDDADVFFALFTAQVTISFLFEQLPGGYAYAFVMCLIGARGFIRTRIGRDLKVSSTLGAQGSHQIAFRPPSRFLRPSAYNVKKTPEGE